MKVIQFRLYSLIEMIAIMVTIIINNITVTITITDPPNMLIDQHKLAIIAFTELVRMHCSHDDYFFTSNSL